MIAAFTMSYPFSPSSSFSFLPALNPPTHSPFPPSPLHGFGCGLVSIPNFTITRNVEEMPPFSAVTISTVRLRPFKRVFIQCSNNLIATTNVFTDAGTMKLFSLFQGIGINEKETELLLDNYPSLGFVPSEFIGNRILSLQSLRINDLALSRLVRKRPEALIAREIDSLLCFLRDDLQGKIVPAQLERLLAATEPRFFRGFEEKVRLLLHHGVPQEKLHLVLNKVNLTKAICLKSVGEIERTFTYLNHFGGVDLIVRRPAILAYDLDKQLIPRIGFLLQLSGGDEHATATLLLKLPLILAYSVEHLGNHVDLLRSFAGLSNQEIFRILLVYPNVVSASRKRKLHPRIDFLKRCGLKPHEIFRFLMRAPLFLSLSFEENLAYKLVFLIKIGYKNRTKELATAMGAVTRTSCKNMQEVITLFLNYGLTYEDILAMSKKHPQILQYNHGSLEEKMNYLIEEMGREISELLAFPAFLGYKLDGRIKHRYEVRKKILGEGMSLNKLLSESAARFSSKNKQKYPVYVIDDLSGSEG